jgi:hypothetical protein
MIATQNPSLRIPLFVAFIATFASTISPGHPSSNPIGLQVLRHGFPSPSMHQRKFKETEHLSLKSLRENWRTRQVPSNR